ncbi:MAG: adenylate/guanylate cyclase domain-containing protein, partial [Bradyrhizobium sp.]|nr:adenylate/guanylate cyclase domain-containing protein [Bradyrhizobium sp.]
MQLPSALSWLVDAAASAPGADRLLAELGSRLIADGVPLAGGALTFAVPDPIIARRTWLWRADTGRVTEAFGFAGGMADGAEADAGRNWLKELASGTVHEDVAGTGADAPVLGWIGASTFAKAEAAALHEAARFAVAPLAALAARTTLQAALQAYLGKRTAARVLASPLRRSLGETIRATLLYADLRGFTALSESIAPAAVIAALDAWFDRIGLAVHAFGGEVLKFMGDGMLAIFPVSGDSPRPACDAALRAVI